jgi:hypothetical protein
VDVLDRVLDKGLVVAGDIRVSLAEVELLTIRVRLIVCSLDKAQAIGLDWWKYDRYLSPGVDGTRVDEIARQLEAIQRRIAALEGGGRRKAGALPARARSQARPARVVRRNTRSKR